MPSLAIVNIGTLISGDLARPLLPADALVIREGRIAAVGRRAELDLSRCAKILDANGGAVCPGLIDSHVHVVFGDWTPRQNMIGWIETYIHGGVTTLISAGEMHLPGRSTSPAATKALAILAAESFRGLRPGGMKVMAGRVMLEPGLTEADIAELAANGVTMAKGGYGAFPKAADQAPLVAWAKRHGMIVTVHSGGPSIPGSNRIWADDLMALDPHICAHINGGPTTLPDGDVVRIVRDTTFMLELIVAGSTKSMIDIVHLAREFGCLDRIIIGTDTPTGSGIQPLGMWKTIGHIAWLARVPAEAVIAMATGNTARLYALERGRIAPGLEADLLVCDAPLGSPAKDILGALARGEMPAVGAVLVDGEIKVWASRNTPPPMHSISLRQSA
jgi:enamidase